MLARQREGIARAQAEGKYTGRKPTARAKTYMVKLAWDQGVSKAADLQGLADKQDKLIPHYWCVEGLKIT